MLKVSLLIDGGYLRELARQASKPFNNPDYIEKVARSCVDPAKEELFRALYYDCSPYFGKVTLPVSNQPKQLGTANAGQWLKQLAQKELFAVRKGELKFRGWEPKTMPVGQQALTDADFKPRFAQKGVDMRIGLDIATISNTRSVDRIALLTGDTDFIPPMKYARTTGLQVIAIVLPNSKLVGPLLEHVDIKRPILWP